MVSHNRETYFFYIFKDCSYELNKFSFKILLKHSKSINIFIIAM